MTMKVSEEVTLVPRPAGEQWQEAGQEEQHREHVGPCRVLGPVLTASGGNRVQKRGGHDGVAFCQGWC